MSQRVTITIDDRTVEVPAGTSVVDAAHAAGIEIPIFCHHPRLEPVGMCRMCLVEVGMPDIDRATGEVRRDAAGEPLVRFMPKLQAGCTTPASAGLVIRTATEPVAEARRSVLEFLLTSHPLDCPVCDKGGECPLQNLTMRYGPGQSRFAWAEKYHFPKPVPIGPLIVLDRERCVLCARCIRFQDEVAADPVLGFENRGRGMEIVSFSDPPFESYFSGNTSDICPVGALTTKDFRFEARAWELVPKPSVCAHCPVGCNLMLDTRFVGRIERVMPRQNEAVNEIWICDKGRFAHHYASAPSRLTTPLVRRDGVLVPATWDEALDTVAERLAAIRAAQGPEVIGGIAGDSLPNEDLYLFGRFLRAVIGSNHLDHRPGILRDDTILRYGAGAGTRIAALGAGATVVVAGLDLEEEAPVLFLQLFQALAQGARVVVIAGRPQKLDRHAEVTLRYRYGGEDSLLAVLLAGLIERRDAAAEGGSAGGPEADALDALREALLAYTPDTLAGVHPVRPEDLALALDCLAGAEDLLILYGREAQAAGWLPALAALAALGGRCGQDGSGLVAVGPHANSQGAADLGILPDWLPGYAPLADEQARRALAELWPALPPASPGQSAEAMLAGGLRALYLLGTDPVGDDPGCGPTLESLDFLVVQELFLTETARLAHVVLPAQSVPERDGSFTSCLRRVQRFEAAVRPVGEARPGWRILAELGQRLGVVEPYASAADVMDEIARALPIYADCGYASLGGPPPPAPTDLILPFAPATEARPVSYAGTAYASPGDSGRAWPLPGGPPPLPAWRPRDHAAPLRQPAEGLILVPSARLYDAGALMRPSEILQPLVPRPYVELSPFDAAALGLAEGAPLRLSTEHGSASTSARIREGLTPGTVLAPEGLAWAPPLRSLLGGAPTAPVRLEALAPAAGAPEPAGDASPRRLAG